MRIVFIHQNIPGQYRALMPHYASDPANEVFGIGEDKNIKHNFIKIPDRLRLIGYRMPDMPDYVGHSFMKHTDPFYYRGEIVARCLLELKKNGFKPDVVCAHPGWGESLFVKDVFPDTRLINYCEFLYHSTGQDFGFDPEFPEPPQSEFGIRARNNVQLISLDGMDYGISPTRWQATRYPIQYQPKIATIHEGVKTEAVCPDQRTVINLLDRKVTLTAQSEVITFINRNFEPYRGFHVFMRALPEILARRPNAHVIMIGGDDVSYGKRLSEGTWRQWMLNQVGSQLDLSRVHFVGKVAYNDYLRVLQISTVHVYMTYPFVLSWSMLESMSAGCLVVGSRTAPVMEVLKHGDNGLLVDFFNREQLVETVVKAIENRKDMMDIRRRARQTIIDKYDFNTVCLPKQFQLIEKGSMESFPPVHPNEMPYWMMDKPAPQDPIQIKSNAMQMETPVANILAQPLPSTGSVPGASGDPLIEDVVHDHSSASDVAPAAPQKAAEEEPTKGKTGAGGTKSGKIRSGKATKSKNK